MARVLIVEDDAVQARLLKLLVEAWGYEVQTAGNAGEALTAVHEALPDAVVTDVEMPGLDGLQLTRVLKADPATRAVPVIVTSTRPVEREAIAAGSAGFVSKPISPDRLLALLRVLAPP